MTHRITVLELEKKYAECKAENIELHHEMAHLITKLRIYDYGVGILLFMTMYYWPMWQTANDQLNRCEAR